MDSPETEMCSSVEESSSECTESNHDTEENVDVEDHVTEAFSGSVAHEAPAKVSKELSSLLPSPGAVGFLATSVYPTRTRMSAKPSATPRNLLPSPGAVGFLTVYPMRTRRNPT